MKVNKIDIPRRKKTLSELGPGDLFEYDGRLFIKTDRRDNIETTNVLCVVLCSGRTEFIKIDTTIEEAVLVSIDDGMLSYSIK